MPNHTLSRRQFASSLGLGLLARPVPAAAQTPAPALPAPPTSATAGPALIGLDSNENPYGPSARALAAMTRVAGSRGGALPGRQRTGRWPIALARLHGVAPEQIVLGCGSGEILKMADAAFLGPGKTVVAAEPTFEAVLDYARGHEGRSR